VQLRTEALEAAGTIRVRAYGGPRSNAKIGPPAELYKTNAQAAAAAPAVRCAEPTPR
jgi:hypothetical protein